MEKKRRKKKDCDSLGMGYYHFCTDGLKAGCLFYNQSQYAFGMTLIATITLLFKIKIYAFVLMPNHIHIILSGKGEDCYQAFKYLKRRISARLVKDGYPPLPEQYDFKLVPIDNMNQMKSNIIYVVRNPYEKGLSLPGGYPWGSGYLYYSTMHSFIDGVPADRLSARAIEQMTGRRLKFPNTWKYHQVLGILPSSFVDISMVKRLFHGHKEYMTSIIKDYESLVKIADSLEEGSPEFDFKEIRDIVIKVSNEMFKGKDVNTMSTEEKYRLAAHLYEKYRISIDAIAKVTSMTPSLLKQVLRSKDYGIKGFVEPQ